MGMLKHCISGKREENNNGTVPNDIQEEAHNKTHTNAPSNASKDLPANMERRLSNTKHPTPSRTSTIHSLTTKSIQTNFSLAEDSYRSLRQSRASHIGRRSQFPERLESQDKKQTSTSTAQIVVYPLLILCALLCVLVGCSHYFVIYFPDESYLNHGDVKVVQYSSLFCESVTVEESTVPTRLTVVSVVKLLPSVTRYERFERIHLQSGAQWERSFYLMERSYLIITVKSRGLFDVLFFKGTQNYNIWNSRKGSNTYFVRETCCANKNNKMGIYTLFATTEDKYFVVFFRSTTHVLAATVDVNIAFNRTALDYSSTVSSCQAKAMKPCDVDITFNSRDHIAVEVPRQDDPTVIPKEGKVVWKCKARVWFYAVATVTLFLILALIICLSYVMYTHGICRSCLHRSICWKYKQRKRAQSVYTSEYNNDAYDEISPSPSMLSLHWDSELQNESFDSYQHLLRINSTQTAPQINITCNKCEVGSKCICRREHDMPSRIATIYSDFDPSWSEMKHRNDFLNTTDSGVSLESLANMAPLRQHRLRATTIPRSTAFLQLDADEVARPRSEMAIAGRREIRRSKFFRISNESESLTREKISETASRMYANTPCLSRSIEDEIQSSEEVII